MSTQTLRTFRRPLVGAAGLLAAGLLLAACGGGSSDATSGSGGTSSTTAGAQSGSQTVKTGSTDAGTVLVDSSGKTIYMFEADKPGKSNCTGACLQYWPPVVVSGTATHSSDVTAKLATLKRSDGTTQLTVNGWPAYTYAADSGPGQATGQGQNLSGGLWWVLSPSGTIIKGSGGSDSSSSSSGGGGHGY